MGPITKTTEDILTRPEVQSFANFFEEEYDLLFRAMWLATKDKALGEDIAQEAMARILQRWNDLGGADYRKAYLYRTAFNLQRRLRYRAGLQRKWELTEYHKRISGPQPDESGVEIMEAIARLSQGQREALIASCWLGLSPQEVANALKVPASTVRVRLHRAREALKTALQIEE